MGREVPVEPNGAARPDRAVAGWDITNFVSLTQLLEAAEAEVEQIEASPRERETARRILRGLAGRSADVMTGAGGDVAGQALANALGLGS